MWQTRRRQLGGGCETCRASQRQMRNRRGPAALQNAEPRAGAEGRFSEGFPHRQHEAPPVSIARGTAAAGLLQGPVPSLLWERPLKAHSSVTRNCFHGHFVSAFGFGVSCKESFLSI